MAWHEFGFIATARSCPRGISTRPAPDGSRLSRQNVNIGHLAFPASCITELRKEKDMFEALSAKDGTIAAGLAGGPDYSRDHHSGAMTDLRRIGINPNFWYPVAASRSVRKKKTFAATFAGERIALYRGESGTVYALED